jgi:hypothetical protein
VLPEQPAFKVIKDRLELLDYQVQQAAKALQVLQLRDLLVLPVRLERQDPKAIKVLQEVRVLQV